MDFLKFIEEGIVYDELSEEDNRRIFGADAPGGNTRTHPEHDG